MEDEETIREVLTEYMTVAGFKVTGESDGNDTLNKLLNEEFDLAVLDIMVPGISGLEVLSKIREKNINIPVIMLTALDDEKTQIEAFNSLADDFVSKPVSPIILIKRMDAVLRRAKSRQKNNDVNLKEEGLKIIKESYDAFHNGKSLNLTVSEFLILETLMSRPEMIYTRDQLISKVFHDEYITSPRIIDTHIKNLRKKLPENFIRTVVGVGYQFQKEK